MRVRCNYNVKVLHNNVLVPQHCSDCCQLSQLLIHFFSRDKDGPWSIHIGRRLTCLDLLILVHNIAREHTGGVRVAIALALRVPLEQLVAVLVRTEGLVLLEEGVDLLLNLTIVPNDDDIQMQFEQLKEDFVDFILVGSGDIKLADENKNIPLLAVLFDVWRGGEELLDGFVDRFYEV